MGQKSVAIKSENENLPNKEPGEMFVEFKSPNVTMNDLIKREINTQIQLYSARIYSRLKEFDMAKDFYQKAIKNSPNVRN